jgi:hypothetical protein
MTGILQCGTLFCNDQGWIACQIQSLLSDAGHRSSDLTAPKGCHLAKRIRGEYLTV